MRHEGSSGVPVVVMGLGGIGQQIVRAAVASSELNVVGAVDNSTSLVNRVLGDVVGEPSLQMKVSPNLESAVGRHRNVVLLHATGSRVPQVMEQLLEAVKMGLSVVSTCEELAFPHLKYPELADKLDTAAQKAKVSVVGVGVNPGFVLDRLVATLGQVCGPVRRLHAVRIVDARLRREALQRKVGGGMTEEEFHALAEKDLIGHVGLVESAALAALGLGLDCDDFEEELVPVIAEEDIEGGAFVVKKGRVAGMSQVAVGLFEGVERVRLELTIALGAESPHDKIVIEAEPRVEMVIPGGIAGDLATANTVIHAAPRMVAADKGLLTVLELPAGR